MYPQWMTAFYPAQRSNGQGIAIGNFVMLKPIEIIAKYTLKTNLSISVPLRNIESQLPATHFFSRPSFLCRQPQKIDAISEYHEYLTIQSHQVPISRRSKEEVIKHLKMI